MDRMPTFRQTSANRLYHLTVRRDLRHNYLMHLAHGLLGQTGFRLVHAPTFMPAFVLLLSGGSDLAVGICLSLQGLGMALSPFFGAWRVEHRKRVLPTGIVAGAGMRLMVLSIALIALSEFSYSLWILFPVITLLGVFTGIQSVIFVFLLSKVIPVSLRGRLTGLRNFLAGITVSITAWLAGDYLLGTTPEASDFAYIFLLAFLLSSIGLVFLAFVREPQPPDLRPATSIRRRFRDAFELLGADSVFRHYVYARALSTLGRMAAPFYILYAGQNLGISGQTLGLLTFVFTLSATVSNLIWGSIADRLGFRSIFLASLVLWIVSTLVLLQSVDLIPTVGVFIAMGAAFQGFQNASANMTLEFGKIKDLPMRIAVANTLSEGAGAIGPVVGGILAGAFSYSAVFWVSIGFLTLGMLLIMFFVPDPRHSRQPKG